MSKRGDEFYQQAEKALTKFRLFNSSAKWTEAAELFQKAGNSFKSIREWEKAGDAYARASDCLQNVNQVNEAAIIASDAAQMYAKQPETATKALEQFKLAVRFYRENSKPTQAARLLCDAAKIFQDQGSLDSAIKAYEDAALLYDDENQPSQAANQLAIAAELYSQQKKWVEASNTFKEVANRRLSDRLMALSANDICAKSIICRMAADDTIGAESLIEEFKSRSPSFERSRENQMLLKCIQAYNDRNANDFATAVSEYDQIKPLDNFMTTSLLAVKKMIEGDDEDLC